MALAIVAQASEVQGNSARLSGVASGGTGPYTYQWYMDTTPGFTPSGANDIPGATSAEVEVTGLIENTIYYFKVIVTDTGNSNVTATSNEVTALTQIGNLNPNQFAQSSVAGKTDLALNFNTVGVEVDSSETGIVFSGSPLKITTTDGGVPKVVKATADTDRIHGYANYNPKQTQYRAGDRLQMSMAGNCITIPAGGAIGRGLNVTLQAAPACVNQATGSSGDRIVGWAYDGASAPGELIRVILNTPYGGLDS